MKIKEIVQDTKYTIQDFQKTHPNGTIIIRWATATGKTWLSILLSKHFDTEIISADSRQIFRYMNIGTDKVGQKIRQKIPHHQIDIINPDQHYTAWQRKKDTEQHIQTIINNWKLPIIVGGTWLYIDTIYKNFTIPECPPNYDLRKKLYAQEDTQPWFLHQKLQKVDPKEAQKIHPNSLRYLIRALEIHHETGIPKSQVCKTQPVTWPLLMIGLRRNKESTNKLINTRIKEMLKWGLIEEVKDLLTKWYKKNLQSMQGIGYKETIEYLEWKINLKKLEEQIKKATHHLAKKQRTRFRRYITESKQAPKKNVTYKTYQL